MAKYTSLKIKEKTFEVSDEIHFKIEFCVSHIFDYF